MVRALLAALLYFQTADLSSEGIKALDAGKYDEAVQLWREIADLPVERIQRRGMADNYWSMGIPGPCGPSSGRLGVPAPAIGSGRRVL